MVKEEDDEDFFPEDKPNVGEVSTQGRQAPIQDLLDPPTSQSVPGIQAVLDGLQNLSTKVGTSIQTVDTLTQELRQERKDRAQRTLRRPRSPASNASATEPTFLALMDKWYPEEMSRRARASSPEEREFAPEEQSSVEINQVSKTEGKSPGNADVAGTSSAAAAAGAKTSAQNQVTESDKYQSRGHRQMTQSDGNPLESIAFRKAKAQVSIPYYGGKKGELYPWMERAVSLVKAKLPGRTYEQGRLVRMHLQHKALSFVLREDPTGSWDLDRLCQELAGEFEPLNPVSGIAYLTNISPISGESAADFLRRFEEFYNRVFPGANPARDKMLIGMALRVLPIAIRERLQADVVQLTFAQFRAKVVQEEAWIESFDGKYIRKATAGFAMPGESESTRPRGILRNPRVTFRNNEMSTRERENMQTDIQSSVNSALEARFNDFALVLNQIKSEMEERPKRTTPNRVLRRPESDGCYRCGQHGHFARECPTHLSTPPPGARTQTRAAVHASEVCYDYGNDGSYSEDAYEPLQVRHPLSETSIQASEQYAEEEPLYSEDEDDNDFYDDEYYHPKASLMSLRVRPLQTQTVEMLTSAEQATDPYEPLRRNHPLSRGNLQASQASVKACMWIMRKVSSESLQTITEESENEPPEEEIQDDTAIQLSSLIAQINNLTQRVETITTALDERLNLLSADNSVRQPDYQEQQSGNNEKCDPIPDPASIDPNLEYEIESRPVVTETVEGPIFGSEPDLRPKENGYIVPPASEPIVQTCSRVRCSLTAMLRKKRKCRRPQSTGATVVVRPYARNIFARMFRTLFFLNAMSCGFSSPVTTPPLRNNEAIFEPENKTGVVENVSSEFTENTDEYPSTSRGTILEMKLERHKRSSALFKAVGTIIVVATSIAGFVTLTAVLDHLIRKVNMQEREVQNLKLVLRQLINQTDTAISALDKPTGRPFSAGILRGIERPRTRRSVNGTTPSCYVKGKPHPRCRWWISRPRSFYNCTINPYLTSRQAMYLGDEICNLDGMVENITFTALQLMRYFQSFVAKRQVKALAASLNKINDPRENDTTHVINGISASGSSHKPLIRRRRFVMLIVTMIMDMVSDSVESQEKERAKLQAERNREAQEALDQEIVERTANLEAEKDRLLRFEAQEIGRVVRLHRRIVRFITSQLSEYNSTWKEFYAEYPEAKNLREYWPTDPSVRTKRHVARYGDIITYAIALLTQGMEEASYNYSPYEEKVKLMIQILQNLRRLEEQSLDDTEQIEQRFNETLNLMTDFVESPVFIEERNCSRPQLAETSQTLMRRKRHPAFAIIGVFFGLMIIGSATGTAIYFGNKHALERIREIEKPLLEEIQRLANSRESRRQFLRDIEEQDVIKEFLAGTVKAPSSDLVRIKRGLLENVTSAAPSLQRPIVILTALCLCAERLIREPLSLIVGIITTVLMTAQMPVYGMEGISQVVQTHPLKYTTSSSAQSRSFLQTLRMKVNFLETRVRKIELQIARSSIASSAPAQPMSMMILAITMILHTHPMVYIPLILPLQSVLSVSIPVEKYRPPDAPFVEEEWSYHPIPRYKPLSETKHETDPTFLQEMIETSQLKLGAFVSLGIGTAVTPSGITFIQPKTAWFPFVVEMLAPHWLPVELRHPMTKHACDEIRDPVHQARCKDLLNPEKAREECPHTSAVTTITDRLLGEIRERYQESLDPALNIQILKDICRRYAKMCSHILDRPTRAILNDTLSEEETERRSSRQKRLSFLPLLLSAGYLATSALTGVASMKVKQLDHLMRVLPPRVETIRKSFEAHVKTAQSLTAFTATEFEHLYDIIEAVRCSTLLGVEEIQLLSMAYSYRNYLIAQMENIVEMAHTGRVSPALFGSDRLKELIEQNPVLRNSLLSKEPHLFYLFAKGIPVRLDFKGFRFGFVVEIPVPKVTDVHIRYDIYNVGFHGGELPQRKPKPKPDKVLVHRAHLPTTVILKSNSVLVPYMVEECTHSGALSMCPGSALRPVGTYPCLGILMDPTCGIYCEVNAACAAVISASLERDSPEIANTPAGVLIRAPYGEVSAYYGKIEKQMMEKPHPLRMSPARTVLVTNATLLQIDGMGFEPSYGPLFIAQVFDQIIVNVSAKTPPPLEKGAWKALYNSMDKTQQRINQMQRLFQPDSIKIRLIPSIMAVITITLFIIFIWCWYCYARRIQKTKTMFAWCGCPQPATQGDFLSRRELPKLFENFAPVKFRQWAREEPEQASTVSETSSERDRGPGTNIGVTYRPTSDNQGKSIRFAPSTQRARMNFNSVSPEVSETLRRFNDVSTWDDFMFPHAVPKAQLHAFGVPSRVQHNIFDRFPEYYDDEDRAHFNGELGLVSGLRCVAINAMADSGASVSMVSFSVAERVGAPIEELTPEIRKCVESASGHYVPTVGYVKIALFLSGTIYPHKFFVKRYEPGEESDPDAVNVVLGNDILSKIGYATTNYPQHRLTLRDAETNAKYVFPLDPEEDQIVIRSRRGDFTLGTPPQLPPRYAVFNENGTQRPAPERRIQRQAAQRAATQIAQQSMLPAPPQQAQDGQPEFNRARPPPLGPSMFERRKKGRPPIGRRDPLAERQLIASVPLQRNLPARTAAARPTTAQEKTIPTAQRATVPEAYVPRPRTRSQGEALAPFPLPRYTRSTTSVGRNVTTRSETIGSNQQPTVNNGNEDTRPHGATQSLSYYKRSLWPVQTMSWNRIRPTGRLNMMSIAPQLNTQQSSSSSSNCSLNQAARQMAQSLSLSVPWDECEHCDRRFLIRTPAVFTGDQKPFPTATQQKVILMCYGREVPPASSEIKEMKFSHTQIRKVYSVAHVQSPELAPMSPEDAIGILDLLNVPEIWYYVKPKVHPHRADGAVLLSPIAQDNGDGYVTYALTVALRQYTATHLYIVTLETPLPLRSCTIRGPSTHVNQVLDRERKLPLDREFSRDMSSVGTVRQPPFDNDLLRRIVQASANYAGPLAAVPAANVVRSMPHLVDPNIEEESPSSPSPSMHTAQETPPVPARQMTMGFGRFRPKVRRSSEGNPDPSGSTNVEREQPLVRAIINIPTPKPGEALNSPNPTFTKVELNLQPNFASGYCRQVGLTNNTYGRFLLAGYTPTSITACWRERKDEALPCSLQDLRYWITQASINAGIITIELTLYGTYVDERKCLLPIDSPTSLQLINLADTTDPLDLTLWEVSHAPTVQYLYGVELVRTEYLQPTRDELTMSFTQCGMATPNPQHPAYWEMRPPGLPTPLPSTGEGVTHTLVTKLDRAASPWGQATALGQREGASSAPPAANPILSRDYTRDRNRSRSVSMMPVDMENNMTTAEEASALTSILRLQAQLAHRVHLYSDQSLQLTGFVQFASNLVFGVDLIVNYGEEVPALPIPEALSIGQKIIAYYHVQKVKVVQGLLPDLQIEPERLLAIMIAKDPVPVVTLRLRGLAAARRSIRYPIGYSTGMLVHAIMPEPPCPVITQLLEVAMPGNRNNLIPAPPMTEHQMSSLEDLNLELVYHPTSPVAVRWVENRPASQSSFFAPLGPLIGANPGLGRIPGSVVMGVPAVPQMGILRPTVPRRGRINMLSAKQKKRRHKTDKGESSTTQFEDSSIELTHRAERGLLSPEEERCVQQVYNATHDTDDPPVLKRANVAAQAVKSYVKQTTRTLLDTAMVTRSLTEAVVERLQEDQDEKDYANALVTLGICPRKPRVKTLQLPIAKREVTPPPSILKRKTPAILSPPRLKFSPKNLNPPQYESLVTPTVRVMNMTQASPKCLLPDISL